VRAGLCGRPRSDALRVHAVPAPAAVHVPIAERESHPASVLPVGLHGVRALTIRGQTPAATATRRAVGSAHTAGNERASRREGSDPSGGYRFTKIPNSRIWYAS